MRREVRTWELGMSAGVEKRAGQHHRCDKIIERKSKDVRAQRVIKKRWTMVDRNE